MGDIVETEADVDHIGRLAAIQTKQLSDKKYAKLKKKTLYNEFADKKMISLQVLLIVLNLNLLLSILEKLEHF